LRTPLLLVTDGDSGTLSAPKANVDPGRAGKSHRVHADCGASSRPSGVIEIFAETLRIPRNLSPFEQLADMPARGLSGAPLLAVSTVPTLSSYGDAARGPGPATVEEQD